MAEQRPAERPPLLVGRGVTRYFGGVAAVQDVDFEVRAGEVLGLIGPNGAGKTTLMNLISGLLPLSRGDLIFNGRSIKGLSPWDIARLGIARTFQIVKPFTGMTLRENVAMGAMFARDGKGVSAREALEVAGEVLEMVGLGHRMNAYTDELNIAMRKRLELARALALNPRLLLLDEVMAGLNLREVERLMELVRSINARGVTIIVIEHVMKAIMGISDRIVVLHYGKKIAEGTPQQVAQDERVITAYLGRRFGQGKGA
ncbi:MAG: ABC transporter ATP-binding protein [Bacillota bacterium]|nr:ABC transporter ATP-binding protein [Bacillota bacterium]REJ33022.1 MAG: ABC transporter ATP-binding protein [Bacillota bacterium]